MWGHAIGEVLTQDARVLWEVARFPLLGAAAGASIGSLRRWYLARWPIGMAAGTHIGLQISLLTVSPQWKALVFNGLPIPGLWQTGDDDLKMASCLAALGTAIVVSILCDLALQSASSALVQRYREHPLRCYGSRPAVRWGCLLVFAAALCWSLGRWTTLSKAEERLRMRALLPELRKRYDRFDIRVAYEHDHFWFTIPSAEALLDFAPENSFGLPKPMCIDAQGADIRDDDLAAALPRLADVTQLLLTCPQITDQSVDTLVACPKLTALNVYNCGLSDGGIQEFHRRRPDVALRVQRGLDWYQVASTPR